MKVKALVREEENVQTMNLIEKNTFELIEMLVENTDMFPFIDTSDILTVDEAELAIAAYDINTRRVVVLVKRLFDAKEIENLDRRLVELVVGEELPYLEDVFCPTVNPKKLKGQGISQEGIVRLKVISYLFRHFKSSDINNKILNEKRNKSIALDHIDNNLNPANIYKKFKGLVGAKNEELYILCFNSSKEIDQTLRYTNEHPNTAEMKIETIEKIASNPNWKAFLFVHNHPNGNSTPSEADVHFTNKVTEVIKEKDKPVLDHVIVGKNNYFSFFENN